MKWNARSGFTQNPRLETRRNCQCHSFAKNVPTAFCRKVPGWPTEFWGHDTRRDDWAALVRSRQGQFWASVEGRYVDSIVISPSSKFKADFCWWVVYLGCHVTRKDSAGPCWKPWDSVWSCRFVPLPGLVETLYRYLCCSFAFLPLQKREGEAGKIVFTLTQAISSCLQSCAEAMKGIVRDVCIRDSGSWKHMTTLVTADCIPPKSGNNSDHEQQATILVSVAFSFSSAKPTKSILFSRRLKQKLCYTETYVRCTRLHFWGFTLKILRRTAEVTVQARTGVGTKLGVYIMREQKKQIVEVMWIQLEFVTCCLYIGMICSEYKAFQRFYKKMVKSCIQQPLHQAGDKGMLDAQDIGTFGCLNADRWKKLQYIYIISNIYSYCIVL